MQILRGRARDLGGGFQVSRLLPSGVRPSVGPFVFLDHFGPVVIEPHMNVDVRPHPHIGLATVTYLFEGAMMHRDSLGSVQRIEPGAINWMSAGRGIVHSERTPEDLRAVRHRTHGLQLWVALPKAREDGEPRFSHTPAARLAPFTEQGAEVSVLLGAAFGVESPVRTASDTLFVVMRLPAQQDFQWPAAAGEAAVYPIDQDLEVGGEKVEGKSLAILENGKSVVLRSTGDGIVVIIGGAPVDAARHLWWNFVSSDLARIDQAAADWQAQRFPAVPGESEYIPLPAGRPTPP